MKYILLIIISIQTAWAWQPKLQSISASILHLSSDSVLKDRGGDPALTFAPNVSSGIGFALEFEKINLGYVFTGHEDRIAGLRASQFNDFRLNFAIGSFDFRLNYQQYKGAIVDSNNLKFFYSDYEVKAKNIRVHYYFDKNHLKYIREGKNLTTIAFETSGSLSKGTWIVGLNVDKREIKLPTLLESQHQSLVDQKNINYRLNLHTITIGPIVGYDYYYFLYGYFLRAKGGIGPGFQIDGGINPQYEIAFNFGLAFNKNNSLMISVDSYLMSFKKDNTSLENNNIQAGIIYTLTL
tara:strand:+ start:274 stop:1158 length:885 start_codon:yes stop_codon:yes gene_type:complete